jgi:magnesium-protoporphyrin O-methyltransferase
MTCCQCQGIEKMFGEKFVGRALASYRRKGPSRSTRLLIDALEAEGVKGRTLLDIGGGVGAIQHALLKAGVAQSVAVEASAASIAAASEEARRQGHADRVRHQHGNFVEIARDVAPADIVTLDRVICCYDDMPGLVGLSASRASRLYGLVYPRETWWTKAGLGAANFLFRLQGNPFRAFVHPTGAVEDVLSRHGLKRRFHRQTILWQVAVFAREQPA